MTNGDEYGDDTVDGIKLATAVTGSLGSETPDLINGEAVYLCCANLGGKYGFLQKIKEIAGGVVIGSRDGKKSRKVTLRDVVIRKWTNAGHVSVSTNTEAFNKIMDWLDAKCDAGDAPFYLFAYNFVDSSYIKLTPNGARYLKGTIQNIDWDIAKGNIYYFKSFDWVWVT